MSRLSVEFMVAGLETRELRLIGTGINLGVGGSTHPLLAIRFLSGGAVDRATALFLAPSGRPKFYRATDRLSSPAYRTFTPPDLIEILTMNALNYSPMSEAGALFFMLGGIEAAPLTDERPEASPLSPRIVLAFAAEEPE